MLIPVWINDYIHYIIWGKYLIPKSQRLYRLSLGIDSIYSQILTVEPGIDILRIAPCTLLGMWLFIYLAVKVIHHSIRGP